MTKWEKEIGIEKVADIKRVDPQPDRHPGLKHHKKKYPPHFQIRSYNWIYPSKELDTSWRLDKGSKIGNMLIYRNTPEWKTMQDLAKNGDIDGALAIYAKHHPETASWPVRFISTPPVPTKREIIT